MNGNTTTLRRGDHFVHSRYLEADYRTPLECVITSVNRRLGVVYYRAANASGPGALSYSAIENVPILKFIGQAKKEA